MGSAASKHVTDPSLVATPHDGKNSDSIVTKEEVATWKSYDYIIVGGGT